MKKSIIPLFIFLLFLIPVSRSYAQTESMMNDISYPFLDKLIATAKQNYPLVKINREHALISLNSYKQSKMSWFDVFSFSYSYNPSNNLNPASTTVYNSFLQGYQVGVTINLGNILEKPYVIKNAKEQYNISQLEQQNYDLQLELEVKTRYFTYLKEVGILKMRTRTSQDAETVINQSRHQFQLGTETTEGYTRATVAFAENNQAKLDAEAAVLISKAALEEIIGKKLEEVK